MPATQQKHFVTNCICADGDDINEMKRGAEIIEREEFLAEAAPESMAEQEAALGYDADFLMETDWHVAYYRSTYRGKPCVYFVWSAIEYVFV